MSSNFKPQVIGNVDGFPEVRYFPVTAAQTFQIGELVYHDTSVATLKVCGADPSLIAGVSLADAAFGLGTQWPGNIYGGVSIPVALLKPDTKVFMASATTPAAAHVGKSYGVVLASNVWRVDTTDESNTRVRVLDIFNSPQQEGFLVQFLTANLQFSGI